MNRKTFTTKKKAFSLIELSIVLIIIGLLVAGVTGGASLIKNAELRGVMTEARGYQTAVNAFQERFQALPGDYNTLIGGAFSANTGGTGTAVVGVTGNGDGQISFYAPHATPATVANRMEGNIALQQLKNGGFIDATFTPATADTVAGAYSVDLTPGTNIPGSKTKNAGWIFDYVGTQNVAIITGSVTTDIAAVGTAVNATPTAVIIPNDALSIDTKTDDGIPNTGKVRGLLGLATVTTTSGCFDNDAAAPQAYNTAAAAVQCALSFQVDPNS